MANPLETSPSDTSNDQDRQEAGLSSNGSIALPPDVAGSGALDRLVETARDYARAAVSENTFAAYAKDWAAFAGWCRMRGADPMPPLPEVMGLYFGDPAILYARVWPAAPKLRSGMSKSNSPTPAPK